MTPISAVENPYIVNMFPKADPIDSIEDVLKDILPKNELFETLGRIAELRYAIIQAQTGIGTEESSLGYEKYLQLGNERIRELARQITNPSDSNDEKMFKIEQWVIKNIKYKADSRNYGVDEYWAYPTQTFAKRSGDCEDGAFLIHSLALAAGVPPERLRTYGGLVYNPSGYAPAGHGWTAYQRESDDEWIVLDWCYWPDSSPLSEREPMTDRLEYIDDFFYIEASKTVDMTIGNAVRNPGSLISIYV